MVLADLLKGKRKTDPAEELTASHVTKKRSIFTPSLLKRTVAIAPLKKFRTFGPTF